MELSHLFTGRPRTLSRLLCIQPPSGTQGSSGEDPHEQSRHTVILGVQRVEEEIKIAEALKENSYTSASLTNTHAQPDTDRKRMTGGRNNCDLTYIKGLSEAVRQILAPLAIKVVFSLLSTLRKMLVHSNDPVPSDQGKGVVSSIP